MEGIRRRSVTSHGGVAKSRWPHTRKKRSLRTGGSASGVSPRLLLPRAAECGSVLHKPNTADVSAAPALLTSVEGPALRNLSVTHGLPCPAPVGRHG